MNFFQVSMVGNMKTDCTGYIKRPVFTAHILKILLSALLFCMATSAQTTQPIPDNVRYILEDLYGPEMASWPKYIYNQDINGDALSDWVAAQHTCMENTPCEVDLVLCKNAKGNSCSEYCYAGSGNLQTLLDKPGGPVCDSSC